MTLLQCEISLHTSGEANNFGSDALSIAIKDNLYGKIQLTTRKNIFLPWYMCTREAPGSFAPF